MGPRGLPARRALARLDTSRAHALVDRLQHLRDLGQLPPDCDPADLARLLVVIIKGLAVQAASGTSQAELRVVAEPMMSYLPVRVT
ncbi:TetR family transcriptional regulator C-terminal domain-containing protein [Actinacidiphila guanduensis]|uniref:TetR family transcriptional regulator C-terminal domain-containing protein n=1 Tax=Actinacidiphila guanduensis TaxID=310781 RepID=UPI001C40A6E6|nr:TetR family transcriptional regulator C-terminal domain-containing protein [Actinacidiphila guanduensis]